ncbi:MAG: DUF368 domain-containing protein [Clostridia bacterium]|nr:DUF368 domain-containing protein [Clostridia bacterium]
MKNKTLSVVISYAIKILKGALIGLAVLIPGVSGGSMVMSMGIYEQALCLTSRDKSLRRGALKALWPYILGLVVGVLGLAFVISFCLERFPFETIMAFVGLILGSLPMLIGKVKREKFKPLNLLLLLLMVAIMIALPNLSSSSTTPYSLVENVSDLKAGDYIAVNPEQLPDEDGKIALNNETETVYKLKLEEERLMLELDDEYVFSLEEVAGETIYRADDKLQLSLWSCLIAVLLGFIASGTMIIPGISGSMVMLVMGYYTSLLSHITGFTTSLFSFDWNGLLQSGAVLVFFGVGVLIGLVLVSRLLKWLMDKHPAPTYYAIIGLMVSSPYAIFVKSELTASNLGTLHIILGAVTLLAGFAAAWLLGKKEA